MILCKRNLIQLFVSICLLIICTNLILDLSKKGLANGKSTKPLLTSECIHVMSVGTRDKLLEVWISCKTGKLLFR